MRAVDLALYADELAAEAAALAARLERARAGLCRAAIEAEARRALPGDDVARLERIGALGARPATATAAAELADAERSLAALGRLQAWVEERLASAQAARPAASAAPFGG